MIRITKLDRITASFCWRASPGRRDRRRYNVRDLAAETRLPAPDRQQTAEGARPTGLLVSQRGVKGGYALARPATEITIAQIIRALDGPIAVTDCSAELGGRCELEKLCAVRSNWQRVNLALRDPAGKPDPGRDVRTDAGRIRAAP